MSRRHRSTRTPTALCPTCGYTVDAASSLAGNHKPEPGDWSLCLRCAAVNVFDAALRLAPPGFGAYEALRFDDPKLWQHIERARVGIRCLQETHPIPDRGGHA